jgi:hypothetical protein
MRAPSRRMPKYVPERLGMISRVVLVGLGVGLVGAVILQPSLFIVFSAVVMFVPVFSAVDQHRQRRLAAERASESVCTFARSFDCRETDTWIVRAVWEEVGGLFRFPIRRDDRFEEDLRIDSEDLDNLAEAVAQRTGRPLVGYEKNPLFGQVKTVGDLVSFFLHQPQRG